MDTSYATQNNIKSSWKNRMPNNYKLGVGLLLAGAIGLGVYNSASISNNRTQIESNTNRVESVERRTTNLEDNLGQLTQRVTKNENKLSAHLVDYGGFKDQTQGYIATINGKIQGINENIRDFALRLTGVDKRVDKHGKRITTLEDIAKKEAPTKLGCDEKIIIGPNAYKMQITRPNEATTPLLDTLETQLTPIQDDTTPKLSTNGQREYFVNLNFDDNGNGSLPFVFTRNGENYSGSKVRRIANNEEIILSQDREYSIDNLSPNNMTNLVMRTYLNPRLYDLKKSTRDARYLIEQGRNIATDLDVLKEHGNLLEDRIKQNCNNEGEFCVTPKQFVEAVGIAAMYHHAANYDMTQLGELGSTNAYLNNLKEGGFAGNFVSILLPGDDYIAQQMTASTGVNLDRNFKRVLKDTNKACQVNGNDLVSTINCVDNYIANAFNNSIRGQEK